MRTVLKRTTMLLVLLAACSGQMCGEVPGGSGGGQRNICGRQWYDSSYRVAWNPPPGTGPARLGTSPAAALYRLWTWQGTTPPTEFSLMVLKPAAEKTLAEFRAAWLDTFANSADFTVLNESYVTLSDNAQAWYLALSPNDRQGINSEFMMTVTQERLVYLNAVYSADYVSDDQAEQIGDALISLCADLN